MAVGEQVGREPHRRLRREDVVPAGDVLLEDVVLHRPAQRLTRDALLLRDQLVQQEQQRRRSVDRHRRRDLVERDAVEEHLHVGERIDRDARAADLAGGARVVRVEAELGRQVERDREAGLAALEQEAVALVRLLGRREARVLADRPRATAVHVAVRPARERLDSRRLEVTFGVVRGVEGLDLDPGLVRQPVGGSHRGNRTSRRSLICDLDEAAPSLVARVAGLRAARSARGYSARGTRPPAGVASAAARRCSETRTVQTDSSYSSSFPSSASSIARSARRNAGSPASKFSCPAGVSVRSDARPSRGCGSSRTWPRSTSGLIASRSVVRRAPIARASLARVTGWRMPTTERNPYSSGSTPAARSSRFATSFAKRDARLSSRTIAPRRIRSAP